VDDGERRTGKDVEAIGHDLIQGATLARLAELRKTAKNLGSEMKNSLFCNITPCSPLKVNQCFGEHAASIFKVEE
jgi:hypothetical protein